MPDFPYWQQANHWLAPTEVFCKPEWILKRASMTEPRVVTFGCRLNTYES
ncbi:MAG TPA: tRNA (N(6)-L-threonylcarbamoyladenosine(37)-C(2))-methylthiotransferase MtaB, partial [Thalassospira sp.]|nr:tRNA (N(6)-L-threonylcarbamoyladenosine(37)-C(2))-methylthiotransferase MtaB [Thalassospira sp.]